MLVIIQMRMALEACHRSGRHIGICGQAPSEYIELTRWLIKQKIDTISLTPDRVWKTIDKLQASRDAIRHSPQLREGASVAQLTDSWPMMC
jgi:phosphoenolpyruvate synthase/pyruvate phosphate dikinase